MWKSVLCSTHLMRIKSLDKYALNAYTIVR
nr:MAG TPA: hypothetical protein [Caudoviricetes sp.]